MHARKVCLSARGLLDGNASIVLDDGGRERVGFVPEDHEGFEPRLVAGLLDTCAGVFEWMEGTSEYRSLLGFLDARVPDGANGYDCAGDAPLKAFSCPRFVYDTLIGDDLDTLAAHGHDPHGDEDREHLARLLADFCEATPRWRLNGWPPKEMGAHEP